MDNILHAFHYIWSFFLVLSSIVFVHEFGHYIIAKWCGVKIEAFSIGFGKELFGWTDPSGTRWKFSLLPLGGYVQMFGDSDPASRPDFIKNAAMSDAEKADSFHHKPLWKKTLVVAAGPVFNFLLTIALLTGLILANGISSTAPIIGEILPDSAALHMDLHIGDRVLQVNAEKVETFNDIPRLIATNLGTPVTFKIERNHKQFNLVMTPQMSQTKDAFGNQITRPLIGIRSQAYQQMHLSFLQAVHEAVTRTYQICGATLESVGQIIAGSRNAKELKGPLGIAKLSGQATRLDWYAALWFIAMLSANLGLVNLFPIPMLDGGHLLYYAIEATTGRPLAVKAQQIGMRFGMALLVMLMAFSLFNDVRAMF